MKKRKRKAKPHAGCPMAGSCPCMEGKAITECPAGAPVACEVRVEAIKAMATKLVKNKAGKLVSARSKTGNTACSQAMSQWKLNGMTPQIAATLGKCRAMARRQKMGQDARAAGNEARAQHHEHVAASGGPITAKDRLARAKELRAKRAGGVPVARTAAPAAVPAESPQLAAIRKYSNRSARASRVADARVERARARIAAITGEAARTEGIAGANYAATYAKRDATYKREMKRANRAGEVARMNYNRSSAAEFPNSAYAESRRPGETFQAPPKPAPASPAPPPEKKPIVRDRKPVESRRVEVEANWWDGKKKQKVDYVGTAMVHKVPHAGAGGFKWGVLDAASGSEITRFATRTNALRAARLADKYGVTLRNNKRSDNLAARALARIERAKQGMDLNYRGPNTPTAPPRVSAESQAAARLARARELRAQRAAAQAKPKAEGRGTAERMERARELRVERLYDKGGMPKRGGDYINEKLAKVSDAGLSRLLDKARHEPDPVRRSRLSRWMGGNVIGEQTLRRRQGESSQPAPSTPAPTLREQAAAARAKKGTAKDRLTKMWDRLHKRAGKPQKELDKAVADRRKYQNQAESLELTGERRGAAARRTTQEAMDAAYVRESAAEKKLARYHARKHALNRLSRLKYKTTLPGRDFGG